MNSPNALIVFFKQPKSGQVKTRLTPFLTSEQAARLYECFVLDTFEKLAAQSFEVVGFVSGELDEKGKIQTLLNQRQFKVVQQSGEGLGERMSNAFHYCFEAGFQRVSIIGTDSPDLPRFMIEKAFETLASSIATTCISGADDGGYVLLGMNRFLPEVFEGVEYSSSETYSQTVRRIREAKCACIELEKWYDVDEPDDLRRLIKTGLSSLTPHTLDFLRGSIALDRLN